jgi:hypothetical protein
MERPMDELLVSFSIYGEEMHEFPNNRVPYISRLQCVSDSECHFDV